MRGKNMKIKFIFLLGTFFIVGVLSGCITPEQPEVENKPPDVDFEYLIWGGGDAYAGSRIIFTDLTLDFGNLTYLWDFGDGRTSTEEDPEHIYDEAGTFTITLTVTDEGGEIGTKTDIITILNIGPEITDIDFGSSTITPNEELTFNAVVSPGSGDIISYDWDFGDGHTSNEPSPTHTYTIDGFVTIKVTVIDENGLTDTHEKSVLISSQL
jgi:PKD repeat protein